MNAQSTKSIGVLGAGSWGTALACLLVRGGHDVKIWARDPDFTAKLNATHMNSKYLADVPLSPELRASSKLSDFANLDALLVVVPAQHMRGILKEFAPFAHAGLPVILCSKGIEIGSLSLMTEVLKEELPMVRPVVLSGPSFASDVARGLPTAVTLACEDEKCAEDLAAMISTPTFRPYMSTDLVGAEIGGATKNVLAIACGIVLGMGLGRSAHAGLIARGFAEMTRLGAAMGAELQTLTGLCGLGDLVLTCSSEQSRNMSCGYALGQGTDLTAYLSSRDTVVEGVTTAPAIAELSRKLNIDMPISASVAEIVAGRLDAKTAVLNLLNRPLKSEAE